MPSENAIKAFMHNVENGKRCSQRKILNYVWLFFNSIYETVKSFL